MTDASLLLTRRSLVIAALAGGAASLVAAGARGAPQADSPEADEESSPTGSLHDWDFLVGRWTVRHSRLKERLADNDEWEEFSGTCVNWTTLGGQGNVDDNVLELSGGTYQGVGIRAFDAGTRKWSIWWIDSRTASIDPPVRGGFKDGVGTFIGDDALRGRPVKVRFRWSKITPTSAHWEQAFSPDGGATWETNWRMDFTRVGA